MGVVYVKNVFETPRVWVEYTCTHQLFEEGPEGTGKGLVY